MAELSDAQLDRLRRALLADPELTTLDDRFELVRAIAEGGMGEVYEATDLVGAHRVAVKVLTGCSPEIRRRFTLEAEILERLDHPAIVRHIAHGETTEARPYLAMEWLDGESLAHRLRRGPLSVSDTLSLAGRVADALVAIHDLGVVHRDLKPSNIVLGGEDVAGARVIDFGIARWSEAQARTASGVLVGTPGYLAPEQAQGRRDLDGRVDLFALGCVVFECLTGARAFGGSGLAPVLALIGMQSLRPSREIAGVPGELDDLVAQLTAHARDERPADARAVVRQLAEIRAARADARDATPPRRDELPTAVVAKRGPGARVAREGETVAERYRIVRFIAAGGMAEVYAADDAVLDTQVALKLMRPEIASDPAYVERFRREVQLARRVTHSNVCRIFDFGVHRDTPFLTMELLTGETLHARLERGEMALAEARPLIAQIAAALDAAHTAGVVHRDLKSSNVMLVPAQTGVRAVVGDFGIARVRDDDEGSRAALTNPHERIGTAAYMAPEQVRGEAAGIAADVYAFGVVMFEMATGALPFGGANTLVVAARRLTEPAPSPRSLSPAVDERWERVIARCLELAPAQRFATAAEIPGALTAVPRRRRRVLIAAAVVAAIAAGVFTIATHRTADTSAYRIAAERWRQKDVTGTVDNATRALARDPDDALAHLLLAKVQYEKGDQQLSRDHARAATTAIAAGAYSDHDRELVTAYSALEAGNPQDACRYLHAVYNRDPGDVDVGLEVAYACYIDRSPAEAHDILDRLRTSPTGRDDPRIDLLEAKIAQREARYADAAVAATTALAHAHALGAVWLEAEARVRIAWQAFYTTDPRAAELSHDARAACRSLHDEVDENDAIKILAGLAARGGHLRDARDQDRERLRTYTKLHREVGRADALNALGAYDLALLEPLASVSAEYAEELAIYTRNHNANGVALAGSDVGTVAFERGDFAAAADAFERARVEFETEGDTGKHGRQLIALARVARFSGDLPRATAQLDRASQVIGKNVPMTVRLALERTELALERGDARGAIALAERVRRDALAAGLAGEATYGEALLARAAAASGDHAAAVAAITLARAEASKLENVQVQLETELAAAVVGLPGVDVVARYRAAGYEARAAHAAAILR